MKFSIITNTAFTDLLKILLKIKIKFLKRELSDIYTQSHRNNKMQNPIVKSSDSSDLFTIFVYK